MHGRHLTRRGDAYVFQIRLPCKLTSQTNSSPIRINLGRLTRRKAQHAARLLGASAAVAFERARRASMAGGGKNVDEKPDHRRAIQDRLEKDFFERVLPFVAAIDGPDEHALSDLSLAPRMVDAALDGLSDLTADRIAGSTLAANQGKQLERHFLALATDERAARAHLGMPPSVPAAGTGTIADMKAMLESLVVGQTQMAAALGQVALQAQEKHGPLFSVAADAYLMKLLGAHGENCGELQYIKHRKAVFLQICADKPVDLYTANELQHFVNEVSHLPPNFSKSADYDVTNIAALIAAGKRDGSPGLSESTLINNYLGRVKTIIKEGCAGASLPYRLEGSRIIIPKGVPRPSSKLIPDYVTLNAFFRQGVASGLLADAILPLLGFLTGRRLGLLSFLRGGDIHRYHDTWVISPRDAVLQNGRWVAVPFKTTESLNCFVLHDFLREIGFVDWARGRDGFLFEMLQQTKDPADTASKRMQRLFDSAGLDRKLFKTFHGLRHAKINQDRELKVDPRTTRLQVGHELLDVHDEYGSRSLRRSELRGVAHVELPPEIEWDLFRGLDFDALARGRAKAGRPPKKRRVVPELTSVGASLG
jgi:integrase